VFEFKFPLGPYLLWKRILKLSKLVESRVINSRVFIEKKIKYKGVLNEDNYFLCVSLILMFYVFYFLYKGREEVLIIAHSLIISLLKCQRSRGVSMKQFPMIQRIL